MRYAAIITKEQGSTLARFPDLPGCQTQADEGESIETQARDAMVGWLETSLAVGAAPPRPKKRAPTAKRILWVDVPPRLAVMLTIRWARLDAGLTQAELARRAGVSQPMVAKLENPDANPSIETLEKVARALGARLEVTMHPIR